MLTTGSPARESERDRWRLSLSLKRIPLLEDMKTQLITHRQAAREDVCVRLPGPVEARYFIYFLIPKTFSF